MSLSIAPPSERAKADARTIQLRAVGRYYKWLDRWVRWSRMVRPYSGFDSLTVHRLLNDPVTGVNGPLVLHRLMLEGIELPRDPRVLDAGCGYGGTAFDLQPKIGGRWLGLTISPIQLRRARDEAATRGLGDRIRFQLQSYDAPLDETFDLVIAIESLVHSSDPVSTVFNLASRLAPGGHFVLVDDMPKENVPAELQADVAEAKRMWRCPVMPAERGWRGAFEAAGLEIVRSADFSALVYHRPIEEMTRLIERDRRRARWLAWSGLRMVPEANIGGLLLERLAVEGVMQYRVLVGRKRG
ncbi:MAG: methyltransferase domain-containing protein [Xanthobacteraceae bacterium]